MKKLLSSLFIIGTLTVRRIIIQQKNKRTLSRLYKFLQYTFLDTHLNILRLLSLCHIIKFTTARSYKPKLTLLSTIGHFFLYIFIVILSLTAQSVWADTFVKHMPKEWQFYQTDNDQLLYSDIIKTNIDDWQTVDVSEILKTNPKHGTYGWYLIHFDAEDILNEYEHSSDSISLFISRIRHADETWINGKKIGGVGTISSPWQLTDYSPNNIARQYQVPISLLHKQENLLVIKVYLGFGNIWGAMQPGGVGVNAESIFFADTSKVNESYHEIVLKDVVVDTSILVFSLVNIFLIVFFFRHSIHNFREFWWLLIDSVVLLGSIFLLDITNILDISVPYSRYLQMMSIFLTPLVISMFFWSVHQNILKKHVFIIFCLVLMCSICLLLPIFSEQQKNFLWIIWCFFHIALLLYCLTSSIIGVENNLIGAKAQLMGILIFIISIRTQWLPTDLFTHRNVVLGSLIMRYALLFSYFQRINQMSHDYKTLSHHLLSTIEQHKQNIARDLHDDLGQRLSAIKLRMLLLTGDDKLESIHYIKNEIDVTMASVRELMQGLHPFVLEQYDFPTALQLECQRICKLHDVDISIQADDVPLNQENKKHLFRIFQETVHNAIKHGRAEHIRVNIRAKKNKLFVVVIDDGIGFNVNDFQASNNGFGLISLKERVAILNGHISFNSKVNQGCQVNIYLPLQTPSTLKKTDS